MTFFRIYQNFYTTVVNIFLYLYRSVYSEASKLKDYCSGNSRILKNVSERLLSIRKVFKRFNHF